MTAVRQDIWIDAWRDLLRVHAVVTGAVERAMSDADIPLTWVEVLVRLAHAPGGSLRMQDLASQLIFSRSGVTRLADRIEAAGLICRAECDSDRRGTYAVITPAGRAACETAIPRIHAVVREHFARHVTAEDAAQLHAILSKILDAYGLQAWPPTAVEDAPLRT